ncbi:MAG: hypothetical protein NZ516_12700 [Raineya sp.]|nr:hypothetical protein [Raineya sp.]
MTVIGGVLVIVEVTVICDCSATTACLLAGTIADAVISLIKNG